MGRLPSPGCGSWGREGVDTSQGGLKAQKYLLNGACVGIHTQAAFSGGDVVLPPEAAMHASFRHTWLSPKSRAISS